jgi:hypothetical protein
MAIRTTAPSSHWRRPRRRSRAASAPLPGQRALGQLPGRATVRWRRLQPAPSTLQRELRSCACRSAELVIAIRVPSSDGSGITRTLTTVAPLGRPLQGWRELRWFARGVDRSAGLAVSIRVLRPRWLVRIGHRDRAGRSLVGQSCAWRTYRRRTGLHRAITSFGTADGCAGRIDARRRRSSATDRAPRSARPDAAGTWVVGGAIGMTSRPRGLPNVSARRRAS